MNVRLRSSIWNSLRGGHHPIGCDEGSTCQARVLVVSANLCESFNGQCAELFL